MTGIGWTISIMAKVFSKSKDTVNTKDSLNMVHTMVLVNLRRRTGTHMKGHGRTMHQMDMEIHFLRCTLAKINQSQLDNVDTLMSKNWELAGEIS